MYYKESKEKTMEIKNKTKFVGARMTDDEKQYLLEESNERGIRLSEYIRRKLLGDKPPTMKNNT